MHPRADLPAYHDLLLHECFFLKVVYISKLCPLSSIQSVRALLSFSFSWWCGRPGASQTFGQLISDWLLTFTGLEKSQFLDIFSKAECIHFVSCYTVSLPDVIFRAESQGKPKTLAKMKTFLCWFGKVWRGSLKSFSMKTSFLNMNRNNKKDEKGRNFLENPRMRRSLKEEMSKCITGRKKKKSMCFPKPCLTICWKHIK